MRSATRRSAAARSRDGQCAPARERGVRGDERRFDVRGTREWKAPERQVRGDRAAPLLESGRLAVPAVDEERMNLPQSTLYIQECGLEALVHRLGRVEHRGVGQAKTHERLRSLDLRKKPAEQAIEHGERIGQLLLADHERRRDDEQVAARTQ